MIRNRAVQPLLDLAKSGAIWKPISAGRQQRNPSRVNLEEWQVSPLKGILPIELPTVSKTPTVYSFPTLIKYALDMPSVVSSLLEKADPMINIVPLMDPDRWRAVPLIAGPRLITIRRKKMRKHKREKRRRRDWFQNQKRYAMKKQKAEAGFRARMRALTDEMNDFDPMEYVKDVIKSAKREWKMTTAVTGRKKYPHWSQLTTLEELYEIEKSDHIDKRSGFPSPEDKAKIDHIKADYLKRYTRNDD